MSKVIELPRKIKVERPIFYRGYLVIILPSILFWAGLVVTIKAVIN